MSNLEQYYESETQSKFMYKEKESNAESKEESKLPANKTSFLDILKINSNNILLLKKEEKNEEYIDEEELKYNAFIKDVDDEFDHLYMAKINDIQFEFKEYLKENSYPFMDKLNLNNYGFFDFIKYSSENYNKLITKMQKENEENANENREDEDDIYFDLNYENN